MTRRVAMTSEARDGLEQPDELGLREGRIVKDRFDDRRLLASHKQNLGLAKDRSPTTAWLREEPDCADDGWQPYALVRTSLPPANQQARHQPRQDRIQATFNQEWLAADRRWRFCSALDHRPTQFT